MRKIILTTVTLFVVLCCVFGMVACNDDELPRKHTHAYESAWTYDSTHHWHECKGVDECDAKQKDKATHVDADENGKCDICECPKIVVAVFEVQQDEFDDLDTRVNGTIDSLQSLLVSKGYTEATVTKGSSNGNTTIRVEVPDVDDPERVLDLIGRPATLEFKGENNVDAENLIVGRDHLESAFVTTDQNGNFAVGLKFNEEGTKKFAEVTKDYLNKATYIFINGELYQTVNVNATITDGSAIITNNSGYSYQEAYDFATQLHAGAFGVKLRQVEVSTLYAPTNK